jgi:hypothetical protein
MLGGIKGNASLPKWRCSGKYTMYCLSVEASGRRSAVAVTERKASGRRVLRFANEEG